MARRNNSRRMSPYRGSWGYYRNGTRPNFVRRAYYTSRFAYRRYTSSKVGKAVRPVFPLTWIAGLIAGMMDVDDKIPAEIKVGLANMPLTGSVAGRVKSVAAGMCFGDLMQKNILPRVGIKLGSVAKAGNSGSGNTGVNLL